jgi:hypothetical protein
MSMLTTTHGSLVLTAPGRTRVRERVVQKAAAKPGYSRWDIAALLGTMFLLLPFGVMLLIGL